MLVPVILSGGMGTRLWPISNRFIPKPFITMPNGKRLIDLTYSRSVKLGAENIVTFTNRKLEFITQDAIKSVNTDEGTVFHLVMENEVKNTAPVFITAAKYIKKYISPDAIMIVMPSDHLIENTAAFKTCVDRAAENAAHGNLLTFGAIPAYPETNYGYIKTAASVTSDNTVFKAGGFTEKPDLKVAEGYLQQGNYYWNMGIFCFHVDALIKQYEIHCPEMPAIAERSIQTDLESDSTRQCQKRTLSPAYSEFREISADYAIMEKANNINVVKAEFDWRDMGSWTMMRNTLQADSSNNASTGNNMLVDCENTFVWNTQKPLALYGLSDVTVIETYEGTMVFNNNESNDIKKAYEKFEAEQTGAFRQKIIYQLNHTTVLITEILAGHHYEYPGGKSVTQFRVISGKAGVEIRKGEVNIYTQGKAFNSEASAGLVINNVGKDKLIIIQIESQ